LPRGNSGGVRVESPVWQFFCPGILGKDVSPALPENRKAGPLDAAAGKSSGSARRQGRQSTAASVTGESKDHSDRRLIFAMNSYLRDVNTKTSVPIPGYVFKGSHYSRNGIEPPMRKPGPTRVLRFCTGEVRIYYFG
jgi:hypothetical protein